MPKAYCTHPECRLETQDDLVYMAEVLRSQRHQGTAAELEKAAAILNASPGLQVPCRHVPRTTPRGPFPPPPLRSLP